MYDMYIELIFCDRQFLALPYGKIYTVLFAAELSAAQLIII